MPVLVQIGNRLVDPATACAACAHWGGVVTQTGNVRTASCDGPAGSRQGETTIAEDTCEMFRGEDSR